MDPFEEEYDEFGNYIGPALDANGNAPYDSVPMDTAMQEEHDSHNSEDEAWMDDLRARDDMDTEPTERVSLFVTISFLLVR